MVGITSPPTPSSAITISKYVGGNSVIELTERSGTLNYKHFANYFTHIFIVFICLEQNLLFLKPSGILHFLDNRSWPEGSYELCSSFHPSNFVRKFSRDWLISFFLKLSMVLEPHVFLCVTQPDFLKKIFFPQNEQKIRFLKFVGKI